MADKKTDDKMFPYGLVALHGNGRCECTYGMCTHDEKCKNIEDYQTPDEQRICAACAAQWIADGLIQPIPGLLIGTS